MVKKFFRHYGLSVTLAALFLITFLGGQILSGWFAYNGELHEHHARPLTLCEYLVSAHFVEATMENWESEFLQMFIYVYITTFLFQKGSAESNDPDKPPSEPRVTEKSPWPVRKGGIWRALYSHSLSLALALLFVVSFWLHAWSSERLENKHRAEIGEPRISFGEHLRSSTFWFQSFQNWQSEFLAIGSMVVLSIFLREKGSPESKPLTAGHDETGK